MKQARISRPSSLRIGMFWRFGFVLDRRPVVVAVWLKVVCSRPVLGRMSSGSASRYVLLSDRGEHPRVGGEAGLATALLRQAELFEQHLAQLLRRADRELLPRELPDLALERGDALAEARADLGEPRGVDPHAGPLDVDQHLDQG